MADLLECRLENGLDGDGDNNEELQDVRLDEYQNTQMEVDDDAQIEDLYGDGQTQREEYSHDVDFHRVLEKVRQTNLHQDEEVLEAEEIIGELDNLLGLQNMSRYALFVDC